MVRIPPERLNEKINKGTTELAHEGYGGRIGPDQEPVVLITKLKLIGGRRVVHGDGADY